MVSTGYVTKAVIVLFSIPLLSKAGIDINLDKIRSLLQIKNDAAVVARDIKQAVTTLETTAHVQPLPIQIGSDKGLPPGVEAIDDAQMKALFDNLHKLNAQAASQQQY